MTISISETRGGRFDHRDERFDLSHAIAQFVFESFAFLLAHLLEFVERLVQCLFETGDHSFVDAVTGRLKCARNSGEDVDVQFSGDVEILLQLLQGVDVAGNQRAI